MPEPTANTPAPAGDTPTPAPTEGGSGEQLNLDIDGGNETPKDITESKSEPAPKGETKEAPKEEKQEEKKPEPKDEAKDADKADEPKVPEHTLESLGYDNILESQQALAQIAVDEGISMEQLQGAIVSGKLDITKLGDVDPKTAMVLKTGVEAEIVHMNAQRDALRKELHNHIGGEANFKAMTEWANKQSTENKAELAELYRMMKQGGLNGKLAVKEAFAKFEADPNTTLPTRSENSGHTENTSAKKMTEREKLDQRWKSFHERYVLNNK